MQTTGHFPALTKSGKISSSCAAPVGSPRGLEIAQMLSSGKPVGSDGFTGCPFHATPVFWTSLTTGGSLTRMPSELIEALRMTVRKSFSGFAARSMYLISAGIWAEVAASTQKSVRSSTNCLRSVSERICDAALLELGSLCSSARFLFATGFGDSLSDCSGELSSLSDSFDCCPVTSI